MDNKSILYFMIILIILLKVYGQEPIKPQKIFISNLSGPSQFREAESKKWQPINKNTKLAMRYELKTLDNSDLELTFEPEIKIIISENSYLFLDKLLVNPLKKAIRMRMEVHQGKFWIEMPSYLEHKLLCTIKTPSALIYLHNAVFKMNVENDVTYIIVLRGSVKVRQRGTNATTIIQPDSYAIVYPDHRPIKISYLDGRSTDGENEKKDESSVAILSIRSKNVKKANLEPISDFVAEEVESQSKIKVIYLDDVRLMLQAEGMAQILTCSTDSCISKIGSLLGVDYVVIGRLEQLGTNYAFNLKMIDVWRNKVKSRVNTSVENNLGLILNEIKQMVTKLVKKDNKKDQPNKQTQQHTPKDDGKERKKAYKDMIWIFPGTFAMGSPDNEGDADEWPNHKVTLSGFFIDKYEVTKMAFQKIMGYNPSGFKGCGSCPVENVSWHEAQEYCEKVNKRLPTEAEWEYACRAGTKSVFYLGNSISSEVANFNGLRPYGGAPVGGNRMRPLPVGNYRPNPWQLYDMYGNVWEWCADWYNSEYYKDSSSKNPTGPDQGQYKVLRGGGWSSEGADLRSANRLSYNPSVRLKTVGFRCVKDYKE